MAIIDPNPIRTPIIIADIKVRRAIAVQVAKSRRQTPVHRSGGELLAILIQKCAIRPRDRSKMRGAIIQIKLIGLAVFEQAPSMSVAAPRPASIIRSFMRDFLLCARPIRPRA